MKVGQKYLGVFLFIIACYSIFMVACSKTEDNPSSKTVDAAVKKETTSTKSEKKESGLEIENATATQESQMISVNIKMKNKGESAQVLKPELFALISNSTVLSPNDSRISLNKYRLKRKRSLSCYLI